MSQESVDPNQCMPWKVEFMKQAVKKGLIGEETPLALFWNLTEFQRQLRDLQAAFPPHFLHTVATKANPLERIIQAGHEAGAGAESASIGEMTLALRVHKDPSKVMLDSPTKTKAEILSALKAGVGLTIDNFLELERVAKLLKELQETSADFKLTSTVGIRINPQLGVGKIVTTSVSKAYGKFGVPIELRDELLDQYAKYPWLNMVHVHAGSQSYSLEQIAKSIRIATDLALDINKRAGTKQIHTIDIGGGVIVNFSSEENTPVFSEWAALLKETVPELFTGEFKVITEYGRRLLAKQGVIVSKIEYTKVAGGRRIVLQHAGADLCVRTVYRGDNWPLRVTAFKKDGTVFPDCPEVAVPGSEEAKSSRSSDSLVADVAGPCCIDDVLAPRERTLPPVQEDDFLMLHDTGAYFHSSWSYYNCRQSPALYCFYEPAADAPSQEITFEMIRPMGTVQDTIDFFLTKSDKKF